MGNVQLNIATNISQVVKEVNDLSQSTDKLNKETQEYGQRSKTAYDTATREAQQLNQAQMQNQQTMGKSMQMMAKFGVAMAGVFSVAAIVQFGKAVVNSTGAGADAMARFEEGARKAFQTLNTAIATADFSNLIGGLRDAFEEGKRYADVLDEIRARQAALGAFKATLETQQAEQRLIARNAANSVEVRQAAIDKIIELEKQKLSETLSLQNTELDEALRAAAVRTGISLDDEESLKRRKDLVLEWASAYGTATGTQAINSQIAEANKLQTQLESLITTTQIYSGDIVTTVKNYDDYNKALKNLTSEEQRLLDLKKINVIISDEERNAINQAVASRAQSNTQSIDQETALQRLRNQLRNELLGEEEKKAKADKERTQSTVEENLASLDKYVEEANKKIFDIELGFGGEQSAEQYQKQIEDNLKGFSEIMADNPMMSDENGYQAKAYDEAQKKLEDELAELERKQKEAFERMQQFAEDHPIAEALGFDNEEQLNQVKDYIGQIMSFVNDLVSQQIEASTRLVEDYNTRIEEQQALVETEAEDRRAGLANNYQIERDNLAKMQKARDQAIKDRERQIKIQRTLSTIEAGISMVTAAANVIKGFSGIPIIGVVLGLAAVAAMIAGFVAAQGKVKDATQMESGGRATYGMLKGRRHSRGGIPIEAEDGEWFINRDSSMKYSPLLDAINRDDQKAMQLYFNRKFMDKLPRGGLNGGIDYRQNFSEIVKELRRGKAELIYGEGYVIERGPGYTKRINLN